MVEQEPPPTTDKRRETAAPASPAGGDTPAKVMKSEDGPQQVVDAARQEAEYPADETDEG